MGMFLLKTTSQAPPTFEETMVVIGVLVGFFAFVLFVIAFIVLIVMMFIYTRNPFGEYPYFRESINITGKRQPLISNLIDEYLMKQGMKKISAHEEVVKKWIEKSKDKAERSRLFHKHRIDQLNKLIDNGRTYQFTTYRVQTRYRQIDYQRYPYTVEAKERTFCFSYELLQKRDKALAEIGYEMPLNTYFARNQRSLMTPALRKQIMERDGYTCRICGRYMPDGAGIHIDHIKPVSKGGKTEPSNLQVLCDLCNLYKSNKYDENDD